MVCRIDLTLCRAPGAGDLKPGHSEYLMTLGLRTPPTYYTVINTGSDLTVSVLRIMYKDQTNKLMKCEGLNSKRKLISPSEDKRFRRSPPRLHPPSPAMRTPTT
ncbi:hypothetical protein AKJ16_DCAP10710 [Drosera capensis]